MTPDVQQAFDEIMDLPPMFRRDYVIGFLRENLPEEDARRIYLRKTETDYLKRRVADGYITAEGGLEKIGKERIKEYFHIITKRS
jgi:hypothetical protein